MNYCPVCTRPVSYTSTLLSGTRNRPIWCEHCHVGLARKTSWTTWAWLLVIVMINAAGLALGFGVATLPLVLLDFYVDAATLKLAPISLDQAMRT